MSNLSNNTSQALQVFSPRESAKMRLICIPYAGGGANVYLDWAKKLPQDVEVCAVQMAGRQNRLSERPKTCWKDVVTELARDERMFSEKPFALFGHSLGALISFELARHLQGEFGLSPSTVLVSACLAPHLIIPRKPPIRELSDHQFERRLRRYRGTPDAFFRHTELKQLLLPMLRADFEMYHSYQFATGAQLQCPLVALGGISDEIGSDELSQWQDHTNDAFRLRMLPGDHFYLSKYQDDLLHVIEEELNPWLDAGDAVGGGK